MSELCILVGEIGTASVEAGMLATCIATGNPVACRVALAMQDITIQAGVKTGIEIGCNWSVETGGELIKFSIQSSKEMMFEMEQTYHSLNSVSGIIWIQVVLSQ